MVDLQSAAPQPVMPGSPSRKLMFVGAAVVVFMLLFLAITAFRKGFLTAPLLPDNLEYFHRRAELSVRPHLQKGEAILSRDQVREFREEPTNPHGGGYAIRVFTRTTRAGQADRFQMYRVTVERGLFLYKASCEVPMEWPAENVLK